MKKNVKINISARHVHLTQEDLDTLFGRELKFRNKLNQIGQFASLDVVSVKTDKYTLKNVRIIGPVRAYTQVEVSQSDARRLGITPPVRKSGNLDGASEVTIFTAKGEVTRKCAIIADRHVHFSPSDAEKYGVSDKETLNLEIGGIKPGCIKVNAKVSDDGYFEVHLDTDDANAFLIKPGEKGILSKIEDK